MEDRVPTKPGRVLITPENGSPAYYATVAMADEPTQVGTALNKQNLLSDPVATLIGLTAAAVPDDMFDVLAHAGNLHVWRRTTSSGTDYPVSVNPNAYQTGSDAKPAGYTLGKVQSVSEFRLRAGMASVSDSISVADDGSIVNNLGEIAYNEITKDNSLVRNKFMMDYASKKAYYIPNDSVITYGIDTEVYLVITKAQPVNTYPAIPAGTTTEYLGKLGDKARIVIGSYVGTGTYGNVTGNVNTLTLRFEPKVVFISSTGNKGPHSGIISCIGNSYSDNAYYQTGFSFSSSLNALAVYKNGERLRWYSTNSAAAQLNNSGQIYDYVAFG